MDTHDAPYSTEHMERAQAFMDLHDIPPGAADAALAQLLVQVERDAIARFGVGANNPPPEARILPERLIDVDALPALLVANYGPLIERGKELDAGAARWVEQHAVPKPADWPETKPWPLQVVITDDADNNRTADFLRQIATYAGGRSAASGEVDEARQKVKRAPFDACKVIDATFNSWRDPIRASAALMDNAQTAYLRKKADDERRDRERLAAIAAREAAAALEALKTSGGDDEAMATAIRAEETAIQAERAVEAPRADLVRSTSAAGTTTGLRANWTFRTLNLLDLVKAVAEGKAPIDFLTTSDSVIRASIKAGRRECAGLEIFNDERAARTGRTS